MQQALVENGWQNYSLFYRSDGMYVFLFVVPCVRYSAFRFR